MKTALYIGLKDLRLRLRDRSAIIVGFIAPLLLATIISFAFAQEDTVFETTIGIADLDRGNTSKNFVEGVRQVPEFKKAITFVVVASEDELRSRLDKQAVASGIVIPEGFEQSLGSGAPKKLKVVQSVNAPISGEVASAIANGFVAEINSGRLALQTAIAAGVLQEGRTDLASLIQKATSSRLPVTLLSGGVSAREVTAASYFSPGMAIFFLFFTVGFGSLGILAERNEGTLARLLASPARRHSVVIGKLLSSFVLGVLSMISMIVLTSIFLNASWGDPLAVAAMTLAIVFAAMGVTGLVITLSRTLEQAQGMASIAAAALALLGGNFIQITDAPKLFQNISRLTPNGWALRAFFDLAAEGGGLETILVPLIAVLSFGLVTGAAALVFGRRLVVS